MGLVNIVRRRVLARMHPICKRVLVPAGALLLVVHVLTWGERTQPPVPVPVEDTVLPGEALDPLSKPRVRHLHDRRPDNAFDTVLRSAAQVDNAADENMIEQSPAAAVSRPGEQQQKQRHNGSEDAPPAPPPAKRQTLQGKNNKVRDPDDIRNSEWSMNKANITGKEKVKFAGHKITENTVTLTVMSSSDKVFMSLNKREIYRGLEDRGMHVVVLHGHTGKVTATRVFDTFFNGTEQDMVTFVDDVQSGRIIVFAIRDEAATGLTWKGRNLLKSMGARFAEKLAYRDMWILIGRKGGLKLAESYSNVAIEDTAYEWGGPLFLRTDFDLDETAGLCEWGSDYREEMRQKFCQRFDGYGDTCRCAVKSFDDVFFKTDRQVWKELERSPLYDDLAVAVMASNRPHYLYRTLKSVREAPGVRLDRVVVFVDRASREITALTKLFGVQLVFTGRRADALNITTPVIVRDKMQYIFTEMMAAKFPTSAVPQGMAEHSSFPVLSCKHLVILEDDMQISVDFFKYMHAVAPVLERDASVAGISGFNYNSYSLVASSLTSFYRTNRFQSLAFMIPARTLHDHIIPHWPAAHSKETWYSGLETVFQQDSNMAIIYPELSRCKHFGYTGYRIQGSLQHAFFDDHKISLTTGYDIPAESIDRLERVAYDSWQLNKVKTSLPVSYNFCKYEYPYGEEPLVVFVNYDGNLEQDANLTATLKCLGAWHLYGEGDWKSTWQFHYHGHPLSLVAVPGSPYSALMPGDYSMTDMTGGSAR